MRAAEVPVPTGPCTGPETPVDLQALARAIGEPIVRAECRASADRSTHALERVHVELRSGRRLDLVLKGTREDARADAFRRPSLVHDPQREAWAYRELLDRHRTGTPRCLGVIAEGSDRERIVLETVPGRPLAENGEPEPWLDAARWRARFHAWGRRRVGSLGSPERLLRQSIGLHRQWWSRAVRTEAKAGRAGAAERLRSIRRDYARAIALLEGTPTGVVHGEFYPSNILVEDASAERIVRPIDWESVGIGPLALDLAALTSGDWSAADRSRISAAYRAAFAGDPHSSTRAAAAEVGAAVTRPGTLAAARMVNAMQWLGWREGWHPPAPHARDWLAEAEAAARDLPTA